MKKRCKKLSQGMLSGFDIIIDTETGVNYLFYASGYAGGLTVLLDSEGKPVITPKNELDRMD